MDWKRFQEGAENNGRPAMHCHLCTAARPGTITRGEKELFEGWKWRQAQALRSGLEVTGDSTEDWLTRQ